MKNLCFFFFALMTLALAANAQDDVAPVAKDVDFKQVCEQVIKAFKDCGYPDPGVAAKGGCSEEIGKVWASKMAENIAANKARLKSMQGSAQNAPPNDGMYKQLECITSNYEVINKGRK